MSNFVSYENAEELMEAIGNKFDAYNGALIFRGTSTFANLPATLTASMTGFMYNVSDAFTTDSRFVEGTDKEYPAGTNIAVADVSTYTAVTPVGNENPSNEGWYELDGDDYVLTTDTTVDSQKTYYSKTGIYKFDVFAGFIDVSSIDNRINDTQAMIAPPFNSTSAYAVGAIVTYEDDLYKFISPHTANTSWDVSEVTSITVGDMVSEPDSLTTAQINALIALLS